MKYKRDEAFALFPERVAMLDAAVNSDGDAYIVGVGLRAQFNHMPQKPVRYFFDRERIEWFFEHYEFEFNENGEQP